MIKAIHKNQIELVVSESFLNDNKNYFRRFQPEYLSDVAMPIYLYMTEYEEEILAYRASESKMEPEEYIISSAYYNPIFKQRQQLEDSLTLCKISMAHIESIEGEKDAEKDPDLYLMLNMEFRRLGDYITFLIKSLYMAEPDVLLEEDEKFERKMIGFLISKQTYNVFLDYAKLMQIKPHDYLLSSAVGFIGLIPDCLINTAFYYLRNIEGLIGYVKDINQRDYLLGLITSIRRMLSDAMIGFETTPSQPVSSCVSDDEPDHLT